MNLIEISILIIFFIIIYKLFSNIREKRSKEVKRVRVVRNKSFEGSQEVGERGENILYNHLKIISDKSYILSNLYIPKRNGSTSEIDVLYINREGIHVFESKNYSGWIFGNEKNRYWTKILYNNFKKEKLSFYNPARQNKNHIKYLKDYLKTVDVSYFSYLVFSDNATFKDVKLESSIHTLCHYNEVNNLVLKNKAERNNKLSAERMANLYEKLSCLKSEAEIEIGKKKEHIKNIEALKKRLESEKKLGTCPICGARLKKKVASRGKYKGSEFISCSNYPKCRYIKS